jgi:hypothetical protein
VTAALATVASFVAAVLTEIYLCDVCSCRETLRRNGRAQAFSRLGVRSPECIIMHIKPRHRVLSTNLG